MDDDFIEIWNASQFVSEVCQKTGLQAESAAAKARYLRKKGFDLKILKRKPKVAPKVWSKTILDDTMCRVCQVNPPIHGRRMCQSCIDKTARTAFGTGDYRPPDARENTQETKFGTGDGSGN